MNTIVDLLQWFSKFLIKTFLAVLLHVQVNLILEDEGLYKPVMRKFEKRKVYSSFKDNIWDANLENIQLINKFNKGIRFLLYCYSKCVWVVPLREKRGITITNAFQKILDESSRKPNKIWVDKCSEFYNRLMKSLLQDNENKENKV